MDYKQTPSPAWIDAVRSRYPTERTIDEALTRKLMNRAGPPYAPTPLVEITGKLEKFFTKHVPGSVVSNVAPLGGGASKEQFSFTLSGKNEPVRYVLRREPPESIVETHRVREFEMMRAMAGTVPVPDVPWVDADGRWFDRPAMISRFVKGVAKAPRSSGNVTGLGTSFSPPLQKKLGSQFVDLLAKIHQFDWSKAELDAFDRPPLGTDAGVQQVINCWDRIWEEDSFEPLPIVRYTAQWLRRNAPPIDRLTVVHHDYRAGNFLFDPDTAEITAVLDWELAHLGDYHEDLAWTLQEGYGYRDAEDRFIVCGLIEREAFLERYSKATGFPVDPKKIAYYSVMNTWKSVIIVLGTGIRCVMGGKSHQDILLTWLAGFGHVCVDSLTQLLERSEHGS